MKNFLFKFKFVKSFISVFEMYVENFKLQKDIERRNIVESYLLKYPNSLIKYGFSVYSQNEEDGIFNEIFNRLNIISPNFIEFGVHPTENNTLALLVRGNSKGVWIDMGLTKIKDKHNFEKQGLKIITDFVTLQNIQSHILKSLQFLDLIDAKDIDLLSLDLDGNDYYFIQNLLENKVLPKLFCLEYNSKFPPPFEVNTKYNSAHIFEYDDYYGCSLQCWYDLLGKYGYSLIYCNITGTNAFFIKSEFAHLFHKYTIDELYQPNRNFLTSFYKGFKPSLKYLINKNSN